MKQRGINFFGWLLLLIVFWVSIDPVYAQGETLAEVGVIENVESPPDVIMAVPVEVRNVTDLYAIDIEIQFDPDILFFEDADPDKAGVQPGLGLFLDAGLTLYNEVDNESGIIRFAMTQVNPSEAKSGDGIILVLYFRGLTEGESDLTVSKVDLSTRSGEAIAVEGVDGSVRISSTVAESAATPIPIRLSTEMMDIPTQAPTEVPPTPTPTTTDLPPTATSTPTNEAAVVDDVDNIQSAATEELEGQQNASDEAPEASRTSIVDYWYVVLLLLAVVIGLAIYLRRTK